MKITLLFALLIAVLAGCGSSAIVTESGIELPPEIARLEERTRTAYIYAVDHPEELEDMPCYCGCDSIGHISNLTCYVSNVAENGAITFDTHAFGCKICVDITHDVINMRAQGIPPSVVRTTIDATYSQFGRSTNTPLPQD